MNAIIEIGTNSLKFLVVRLDEELEVVLDETSITRLGEGYVQTQLISEPAFQRNLNEIEKCIIRAKKLGCANINIYGTMIFRRANNGKEIVQRIKVATGLSVEILSGEEEAEYSYLAAIKTLGLSNKDILVIDTGGGSIEFIFGSGEMINYAKSLDVGAVTLTDKFNLVNQVESSVLDQCNEYLASEWNQINYRNHLDMIIGIGGTVTTISAIIQKLVPYKADKVQGSIINLEDIIKLQNTLASKNLAEKQNISGLSPKRADIILGGVIIIKSILEHYEANKILVCDRGLRYGLALKNWRKK